MAMAWNSAALSQETLRCAELETGPARSVSRVIDGETLALDDGSELRLIGVLAPRGLDAGALPEAWPMQEAATQALRSLVLGKSIELAFGGERADRYGRLQAHAFLIEGERRRWVQGHLLTNGLARAYLQAGNNACGAELLAAEHGGRDKGIGLWAEAAYAIHDVRNPAALLRHHGRFQIVEGKVARVAQVRGLIYLNFGSFRRRAFFAVLRDGDRALPDAYVQDPKGLEGRMVRVRGWIERRQHRPAIDLSAAGMIEVLSGPAGGPRRR